MRIENRVFGAGNALIIAELSGNHCMDLPYTKDSISAMAEAGADAVKLQTYTADSLTLDVDNEHFGPRPSGLWKGRRPYEVFTEGSLPYEWHAELFEHARKCGLICFSSPFDVEGVGFLESLNVPAYKVASFEIAHIPLIEEIASKGKPVIVSSGIASLGDLEQAIHILRSGGCEVALLKCTSAYPAAPDEANLRSMVTLQQAFGCPVGVSDHTMGWVVPVVAVSLGASIIEKHFILDRSRGGIDAEFSMDANDFGSMVKAVREAEATLGNPSYALGAGSTESAKRGRGIFAKANIRRGESLGRENLAVVRSSAGIHPGMLGELLGKPAPCDIKKGEPLTLEQFLTKSSQSNAEGHGD